MTLRVVNGGEAAWLTLITDVDMTMRLFTNDVDSGLTEAQKEARVAANFTEATFTGYAAVSMTTAWTVTQDNPSVATRSQVDFSSTSDLNDQTVRGYYVTRNSDGALQWYEYFDGPILMTSNGDLIRVTPTLTLDDDLEAEVFAKGIIAQFTSTSSTAGFTVDTDTDMACNNVPVVAGRTYAIHFHSTYTLSAAGDWAIALKVNTVFVEFMARANPGAAENGVLDGIVYWVAPATASTDDFLIAVDELSGAATFTLFANANNVRRLTIIDLGVL